MEYLLSYEGLVSLLTLTALEIILGVDNVIFISLVTQRLPKEEEKKARFLGLMLAMGVRICLLLALTTMMKLGSMELFSLFGHSFSFRDLILIGGGLFLLAKSATEIHHNVEDGNLNDEEEKPSAMLKVILQIIAIDIVFSFDSILTAVGLVDSEHVIIMIIAVIISMMVMVSFAQMISDFIQAHPTLKVLALSFLVLVGFLLMMEGFHQEVPKGYVYFAIAFSFTVELINIRIRKSASEKRKAARAAKEQSK